MKQVSLATCGLALFLAVARPAFGAGEATRIRARVAEIEDGLAKATDGKGISIYMPAVRKWRGDTTLLLPMLVREDGKTTLRAVLWQPVPGGVRSISALDRGAVAGTARPETGPGAWPFSPGHCQDLSVDRDFLTAVADAPVDSQVRLGLNYGDHMTEHVLTEEERALWRDLAYYHRNFSYRTDSIARTVEPDTSPPDRRGCWGFDRNPRLLRYSMPPYPKAALEDSIEGSVMLTVLLDTLGLPRRASVLTSSGHALLDRAALRACLDNWFKPAYRSGRPVATAGNNAPYRFVFRQ